MSIYFVALMAMLSQVSYGGSRIAASLLALDLGIDQFNIGMIIALYSLCPMLLSIVIGKFADRVPPRLPILVGSTGMIVAFLVPYFFPQTAMLYAMAFLLGLCQSIFTIPLEAVVGGIDGPGKRTRNYALITMGWSLAGFIGPMVAGIAIDTIGHLRVFLVLAGIGILPILLVWFVPGLAVRSARLPVRNARRSVLDLWRMPYLRITFITAGIIGSAWDLFQFFLPLYAHSVGLSASAIGGILGMVAAAAFVMRAVLPFVLKKYTEPQILSVAIIVAALAYLLLPFFVDPYALGAIAFLLGLGVGCAMPMTMSMLYALTPPGRIAECIGLHKTVRTTTQLVIPIFFGAIGAAFGFVTVLLSNALVLGGSGLLLRKARVPDSALRSK